MIRLALSLALVALATAVGAQSAGDARERLLSAADQLEAAEGAGDRIEALTGAVRAYEAGLSVLRADLRQLTLRERELTQALADEDADIASLLALMQNASFQVESQSLLHPGSATDTIRAGTLAALLVPTLYARAADLEERLLELEEIRVVVAGAETLLGEGLQGVREARIALADALAARTDLPPRLATNEAAMEALINSADTLHGLADSLLSERAAAGGEAPRTWLPPVAGRVLSALRDPLGRPGWAVATEPRALVTAPADASVRFSGEFHGHGTVTILEVTGGHLILFAGLSTSFVRLGQVLEAGAPVGFAGAGQMAAQDKLNANRAESSLISEETLYIEVRKEGAPVDPATVLTLEQEQG